MLKKSISVILSILSLSLSTSVLSGSGHSHSPVAPATDEQIMARAVGDLEAIVDQSIPIEEGVLDESWKMVTNGKIVARNAGYCITAFTHPEEKRTLYMLMDSNGFIMDANFTGKF